MIEVPILAIVWIVTSLAAYKIFKWTWLGDVDWGRFERNFFVIMSAAGPFSLVAAIVFFIVASLDDGDSDSFYNREILERKREDEN